MASGNLAFHDYILALLSQWEVADVVILVFAERALDRLRRALDGGGLDGCRCHYGDNDHWIAVDARSLQHRAVHASSFWADGCISV